MDLQLKKTPVNLNSHCKHKNAGNSSYEQFTLDTFTFDTYLKLLKNYKFANFFSFLLKYTF